MWRRNSFAPRAFDAVVLFTHGEIEYNFSDKTFVAKKGDFLLLPCDLAYSGKMHTDNASYYVVDFRCLCADEFKNYIALICTPKVRHFLEVHIFMAKKGTTQQKYSAEFKTSVIMDMREHHLRYHETARKYWNTKTRTEEFSYINTVKRWERICD